MKKIATLAIGLLFATTASAGTDHYLRVKGNHVQHLKISTVKGETHVSMDVDFEPGPEDTHAHACSQAIDGDADKVGDNQLVMKKQSSGEKHFCTLTVTLQGDEATVKQSEDCSYFVGHFCKFDSEGDTLKKMR